MNNLEDLRATLAHHAEHAGALGEAGSRTDAIAVRVRAVKRRRLTVAVAAVVLAMAGTATVFTGRSDRVEPANSLEQVVRDFHLQDAEIYGFGYQLDQVIAITDEKDVHLDASDQPRAMRLIGTGLDDGSATLFLGDTAVARISGRMVTSPPVPLPSGSQTVRVVGPDLPAGASVAVATYNSDATLPPGGVNRAGTVVFRTQVAGRTLLKNVFDDGAGSPRPSIKISGPLDRRSIAVYCHTSVPGATYHLIVDGEELEQAPCDSDRDPGAASPTSGPDSGGVHEVSAYLTDQGGAIPREGASELGIGLYSPAPSTQVAGMQVPEVVEYDGRTWRLSGEPFTDRRVDTAESDLLVALVNGGGTGRLSWQGRQDAGAIGAGGSPLGSWIVGGVLLNGDSYRVTTSGGGQHRALLYRPV